MFDILPQNVFWTIFLVVHSLLAVTLLGALTHQAVAVAAPVRAVPAASNFVARVRSVRGASYATAVCVLWVLTFMLGAWIYTKYRIAVRIPLERTGYFKTLGFFELKEHATTLGLVMLPAYWYFWHNANDPAYNGARKSITILLASLCWFSFLVGHVLNNVRGFG